MAQKDCCPEDNDNEVLEGVARLLAVVVQEGHSAGNDDILDKVEVEGENGENKAGEILGGLGDPVGDPAAEPGNPFAEASGGQALPNVLDRVKVWVHRAVEIGGVRRAEHGFEANVHVGREGRVVPKEPWLQHVVDEGQTEVSQLEVAAIL